MQTCDFENRRWKKNKQKIVFRHLSALDMISRGTVLDVGCGDGLFLELLRDKKGIIGGGCDISGEGVKISKGKGFDVRLIGINDKLPFGDKKFDYVILLDVLEHVYNPEDLLREAVRVSRKYIIFSVPNFNSLPARIQVARGFIPENNSPGKGHIYWFNLSKVKKIINDVDAKMICLKTNTFFQKIFFLRIFLRLLSNFWPSLFGLSFVVKCGKK